ncbi:hypothetical protein [Streptomyces sp. NPDC088789]|uniref:hypothetical protein n=1 Tax=Streptomyces sp. NPDC088789 TaxID=3365899 RepID=UPI0038216878
MSTDLARLAARVAALERQLARTTRTARLAYSSIEDGAIEVYDRDGSLSAIVGVLPDGTSGIAPVNGAPPPIPTAPNLTSVLGGIAAGWDGTFEDALVAPLDFARTEVHASSTGNFTPSAGTLVATLESPRGGTVTLPVPAWQTVHVRLVGRNTSGTAGEPSEQAGPLGPLAVVADDVRAGVISEVALAEGAVSRSKLQIGAVGHNELGIGTGNLMPDPSFEGAFTDQLLAANAGWSLASGNGSARAVRAAGAGTLYIAEVPVSPGDRFYLAFDHRADQWQGGSTRLFLRWRDAEGTVLGYGTLAATPTERWARASGQIQAPQGAVAAAVLIEAHQVVSGTADFDNAEIRTVIGAGMLLAESIGALELAAEAVQAGKVAAGTITAREVRALSLTGDVLAANSISAGKIAAGAVQTPHLSVGAVTPDHLAVGQGTNLVPDPSFESAATANTIAAGGAPWSLAPGNRTGVGIRVDCDSETATHYTLPLTTAPVLPASQLWLGVDILTSSDLTAQGVKILARWETAAGGILGYGVAETAAPEAGRWHRVTAQVTAPQGATQAVLCLEVSAATAGWAVFDNAEAHTTFGRAMGGSRAEVGPQGLRLYDDTGQEAVSLVTGAPQYLTLRTDGTAVATIDTYGNAGFGDLNVAGDLTIGGDPVTTLFSDRARGIVAIDYQTSSVRTTGTEYGFVELAFEADPTRMYRIVFDATATASAAGGELQIRLRDGGAAKPTISSPQLQLVTHPLVQSGSRPARLELVRSGNLLGSGLHRLLITFRNQYGPNGQHVDLYGAANSPGVLYVEDAGAHVPETGGLNSGGGTTADPVRTYTRTYTASWSGSYAKRSGYNAYYGNRCVQGYYSPNNGTQAALIGFPATLGVDLSGASIIKAEVFLYAEHWYHAGGGRAVIKAHSHPARPTKFSSDGEAKTVTWSRNQGKWVDITSVFDSVKWRGIALDPNTTDRTAYGIFRGVGQTYQPRLRVTYSK